MIFEDWNNIIQVILNKMLGFASRIYHYAKRALKTYTVMSEHKFKTVQSLAGLGCAFWPHKRRQVAT